jgi:hypothetical protein
MYSCICVIRVTQRQSLSPCTLAISCVKRLKSCKHGSESADKCQALMVAPGIERRDCIVDVISCTVQESVAAGVEIQA